MIRARVLGMMLLGAAAGCATPPPAEQPAASEIEAPALRTPAPADEAEGVLRERAQAHEAQGRWADALRQWELLVVLRPGSADYGERVARMRRHIREIAAKSLALAEQARRSGNLERATLEYLRVLSVDHDNERAAQGLQDIERERTHRNYMNRPPRVVM